ncbi:hypothetical protein V1477_007912 [Vespula maculifrons]|uniref:Uncharacterized protein n=1 Tax=Vespula maculifrons TaxID=7453 RepID=A0ABD2CG32_VESMC
MAEIKICILRLYDVHMFYGNILLYKRHDKDLSLAAREEPAGPTNRQTILSPSSRKHIRGYAAIIVSKTSRLLYLSADGRLVEKHRNAIKA